MSARILVLDDAESWRKILQDMLEVIGYEADVIGSSDEAKRLLNTANYDVALLDIDLDQSDSHVAFQTMCRFIQKERPDVPIVAISGKQIEPSFMFKIRESGVVDFISKRRLSMDDFQRVIQNLIRGDGCNHSSDNAVEDSALVSILFVSADPTDASRTRVGQELREIEDTLKRAGMPHRFKLDQQMSLRPQDISQLLLELRPKVVHFSGHGTRAGGLCFEDSQGKSHTVEPGALADLFQVFAGQLSCVVLNACYSEAQAKAVGRHIEYVIGMSEAIGEKAAIAFSIGFYQGLGAGCPIETAYKLGCAQIRLQNIPEHLTPILFIRGDRPK